MSAAVDLATITLEKGAHANREKGVCAMELVAWIAGERHTDSPACVSPILSAFFRRWNDDLDDAVRQRLKPYLPRLIGTANDGHDASRGWILTDWMARTHLPAWLDLAGITEPAAALRGLPAITDACSLTASKATIADARTKSAAAWDSAWAAAGDAAWAAAWDAARDAAWAAAWAAAWDAARAAAGDAAWDSAWDAARDAAWDAAGDAARDAAWDAAGDAAWDSAWDAAWDAASKKLEPTKLSLQESAFALIERLIDPAKEAA